MSALCPSCRSNIPGSKVGLEYDPDSETLTCPRCGYTHPVMLEAY